MDSNPRDICQALFKSNIESVVLVPIEEQG